MLSCFLSRTSIHFCLLALVASIVVATPSYAHAGRSPSTALRAGKLDAYADVAPASPGGSIAGTDLDPDGRPVPDAEVLVTQAASVAVRARTDERGRFRVNVLPGRYDLRIARDGFGSDPQSISVADGQALDVNVRLRLSAVSESVIVSASQMDVPLSLVADSASVMSGRDLAARQIETVADALRLVPGVEIARNGGRGSVTSMFARGGESDYALVLVNGVRANGFGGSFDFSQLPSANVERVEIVRGPGSAVFGSDAIGAVVQIVTRQGGAPRAEGTIEGGSFGTARMTASASGSRGRWSWGGAVERVGSDGFTGIAPASGERVSNDDYRSHQALGSATWRNAAGAQLALNAGWIWSDRGYPGAFGSNPAGLFTGVDRVSRGRTDTRQAGAALVAPLARGRVRQHAQVSWFDLANDFTSLYGLSSSGTRRLAVRSQTDVTLTEDTRLSAGVDVQHERAQNDFITAGAASTPVPIVRNLAGVFAEARHQHGSRLTLSAGVRAENVERNALDGSPNPYTPRPPFGADTARAVNPKVSASYLVYAPSTGPGPGLSKLGPYESLRPAWVRVRASAGTGMRAPDALEIAFTDNPHLKPERSRSVEAGAEAAFAGGQAVVECTAFSNRYDDLIVAVGPAIHNASQYRTDNIANARATGVEIGGRVRTSWGLAAHVAYTWLDSAVLAVDRSDGQAPAPFQVGDFLLRRPRHTGSIDLVFTRGRLTAYSELGARSRTFDVEPTYGTFGGLFWNPGYTTVRAGASWRLLRNLDLVGRVDNVFNRYYEETFGFPALGRSVMAGVRVAAGR